MVTGGSSTVVAAFGLAFLGTVSAARAAAQSPARPPLPGFRLSPWFGEQVAEERTPEGVRVLINAPGPAQLDPARPSLVVIYATPNGNTIEQTMGSASAPGLDWRFDIQHIAAQIRELRHIDDLDNIVVACVQPEVKSWPAWRQRHANSPAIIRELVDQITRRVPGASVRVALTAHSGGGSFLFGYLNGAPTIPNAVEQICFLDANYSFDEAEGHGDKLTAWLNADKAHRLVVLAYDDRKITLDGKPVVSDTGGTYRASHRMIESLGKAKPFVENTQPGSKLESFQGFGGQALVLIHKNPDNKILHTALVGDMNGLLFALIRGTENETGWGTFGGARAYTKWIQPAGYVPHGPLPTASIALLPRDASAPSGQAFLSPLAAKPYADVEPLVVQQLIAGNIPEFMRSFKTIHVAAIDAAGKMHTAEYNVMPDYLSIGSDSDYVRIPLTPMSAQKVAAAFECTLPTRKMVDDIYERAEVKVEPIPLTQDRESLLTFIFHNVMIQAQIEAKHPGQLVGGDKKDVVISNRLQERPNRVAIYGWQRLDGEPIQPLTTIHHESYVDYSHGIRLVRNAMTVDGVATTVAAVLKDPALCILLSDEGPMAHPGYGQ